MGSHHEARVSAKGQITIPVKVRERLDLKEGDLVDFYIDDGSQVVQLLARNKSFADLCGLLKFGDAKAPTPEEIDAAIAQHLREKHDRISQDWVEWHEFQTWRKQHKAGAG